MVTTETYIRISEIQRVLDEKHHQNYLYDALNAGGHYYAWCRTRGYVIDPQGKRQGDSQIWFKEYLASPDGAATKPEILNFFKLAEEKYICESNSSFFYFDKGYDLSSTPLWFKNIYLEICDTFGIHFPDGVVKVLNER